MSGGSYDYSYRRVEEFAESLEADQRRVEGRDKYATQERAEFAALLRVVAKAMHDIEWVDSCDYGAGDENDAIMSALRFWVDHDLSPKPGAWLRGRGARRGGVGPRP